MPQIQGRYVRLVADWAFGVPFKVWDIHVEFLEENLVTSHETVHTNYQPNRGDLYERITI